MHKKLLTIWFKAMKETEQRIIWYFHKYKQTLTVNCFSPDGPTLCDLLCVSLSWSHFHWPSNVLIGLGMVVFRVESGFTSEYFLSCSHKLPGDHILWVLDLPFRERFKGASSSRTKTTIHLIFLLRSSKLCLNIQVVRDSRGETATRVNLFAFFCVYF